MNNSPEIRASIQRQVNDCLWARDKVRPENTAPELNISKYTPRCVVCTLPIGTCVHSEKWMHKSSMQRLVDSSASRNLADDAPSPLEEELRRVLGVLDPSLDIPTQPQVGDIDISSVKWTKHIPRYADKIGDTPVPISLPTPRGWHSLTVVGRYIVLFGGLSVGAKSVPLPFAAQTTDTEQVIFHDDIYLYDIENSSWHRIFPNQQLPAKSHSSFSSLSQPTGRFGHCAAALDNRQLLIFGGRGPGGKYLSDTWVYDVIDNRWFGIPTLACPSRRAFAACVSTVQDRINKPDHELLANDSLVVLFGGTNGVENLGDLWLLRRSAVTHELIWERGVAVGTGGPPAPRYGHSMVYIPQIQSSEPEQQSKYTSSGGYVVIMGGCSVSQESEMSGLKNNLGGGAMTPYEVKQLLTLSQTLQSRYAAEGSAAVTAGHFLEQQLLEATVSAGSPQHQKDLLRSALRDASAAAGRLADLEAETRAAEMLLVETYSKSQSASVSLTKRAVHPIPHMDTYILSVRDMAWVSLVRSLLVMSQSQLFQIHPKIRGDVPSCRMHFATVALGEYIFVTGGAKPTGLRNIPVDNDSVLLYALDLRTMMWRQLHPYMSAEYLQEAERIADADILRAQQKVHAEKHRGHAAGARNGVTMELIEAEAALDVCRWKRRMIDDEKKSLLRAPPASWGMKLCPIGYSAQRAMLVGGWSSTSALSREEFMILDVEQETERRRRLDDEFHARLERDRLLEASKAYQMEVQSLFDLRMEQKKQAEKEARETFLMEIEDRRSALPTLTLPSPVILDRANAHTLWLSWKRTMKNSLGKPLGPLDVTYFLYMSGGFMPLRMHDRVLVTPAVIKKGESSDDESDAFDSDEDLSSEEDGAEAGGADAMENQSVQTQSITELNLTKPYGGVIAGIKSGGIFAVLCDDGKLEKNISRSRLVLEEFADPDAESNWRLIYEGHETSYACEGLVPHFILTTEKGMRVTAKFRLRTCGTEYPIEEFSQYSEISEFSTLNTDEPDKDHGKKSAMSRAKKEVVSAIVAAQHAVQLERQNNEVSSEGMFDSFI